MQQLHLNRKFDAIIAWHSFFHLQTPGTEHGEDWGMNGGENLFHGSIDSHEYESLLQKHYFLVIKHTINDPDCGGATVWMAK